MSKTNSCQQILSQDCIYKTSLTCKQCGTKSEVKRSFPIIYIFAKYLWAESPWKSCSVWGHFKWAGLSQAPQSEAAAPKGKFVWQNLIIFHDCCEEHRATWCENFPVCKICILSLLIYVKIMKSWRRDLWIITVGLIIAGCEAAARLVPSGTFQCWANVFLIQFLPITNN